MRYSQVGEWTPGPETDEMVYRVVFDRLNAKDVGTIARYSTRQAAALSLIPILCEEYGSHIELRWGRVAGHDWLGYTCEIDDDQGYMGVGKDPKLPMAVCRAILDYFEEAISAAEAGD